jgi:hypothetical protein
MTKQPPDDLTDAQWQRVATAIAIEAGDPPERWPDHLIEARKIIVAVNEVMMIMSEMLTDADFEESAPPPSA